MQIVWLALYVIVEPLCVIKRTVYLVRRGYAPGLFFYPARP